MFGCCVWFKRRRWWRMFGLEPTGSSKKSLSRSVFKRACIRGLGSRLLWSKICTQPTGYVAMDMESFTVDSLEPTGSNVCHELPHLHLFCGDNRHISPPLSTRPGVGNPDLGLAVGISLFASIGVRNVSSTDGLETLVRPLTWRSVNAYYDSRSLAR